MHISFFVFVGHMTSVLASFPVPIRRFPEGRYSFDFSLSGLRETYSKRRKRFLPLGERTDLGIDSLSVEARLQCLEGLLSVPVQMRYPVFIPPCVGIEAYADYTQSAMYVEVGILRFLYRFAFYNPHRSEKEIETAADMVEYLKEKFTREYNHSLDFLTPDLIMDWYGTLAGEGRLLSLRYTKPNCGPKVPDTHLVRLSPKVWKVSIVEPRRDRLVQQGYESL